MQVRTLTSWNAFHGEVVGHRMTTVWRGQRLDWLLKSRFDTELGQSWKDHRQRQRALNKALRQFRTQMRRSHPQFSLGKEDDNAWAIGRHHGLWTPMLDWTKSPYVAAYFAFAKTAGEDDGYRFVYALRLNSLQRHLDGSKRRHVEPVAVAYPSPRFSAQKSVLTRALNGDDIERAVNRWTDYRTRHGETTVEPVLMKYRIPANGPSDCERVLKALDMMNINYETLLLDLHAAETAPWNTAQGWRQ
ncbi:MAG: FRG domain-containing protein [Spirochaetes bacterium]|nr:FRG domain-containing protein [Spirochaetota bacterium]